MRQVFCAALVVFALYSPAHAQQQPPTTVAVGVVKAERRPIAKARDFVGRVEAISRVEIRARIAGFLEKVLFKEGDLIKEGSPLYRIERGLFEAQVRQAPTAPTWLPKFAKTEWARGKLGRLRRGCDRQPRIFLGQAGGGWLIALTAAAIASV